MVDQSSRLRDALCMAGIMQAFPPDSFEDNAVRKSTGCYTGMRLHVDNYRHNPITHEGERLVGNE